jgi:exodeoxyribonuclease VII small subunit
MSDNLEQVSFEEAYDELETTVQRLEAGELNLEEAITLYERGMRLAQRCSDLLDAAELQVQELTLDSDQQQMGMFLDDPE